MSYLAISRKYRPSTFSDVLGQDATVRILSNSIKMNRIPQSILLSGMRGVGKTTIARIYAKSLNCDTGNACNTCKSCLEFNDGSHPDIMEIDAASNNGVDFVRDILDVVKIKPFYNKRVFIFDEAHMFTPQAQSALLKIFEDVPKDVVFILASTDSERFLNTLKSRCMNLQLKPMSEDTIEGSIRNILNSESVQYTEGFVKTLARVCDGSLRDIQQILDQAIVLSEGPLDESILNKFVNIVTVAQYKSLAYVISKLDLKISLEELQGWYVSGIDLEHLFLTAIPVLLRDFAVFHIGARNLTFVSGIEYEVFEKNLTLSTEVIKAISDAWDNFYPIMKGSPDPKAVWSMFFIKICEDLS